MKRLLIIDDEENMRKVLSILFRREGYDVTTASNGNDAVGKLKSTRPFDLIISDLKMPKMDGVEFLKYLKHEKIEIPLILLTAYGSISEAVDAMKLGAVDFITKPFNKEDLKNIVHRSIHGTTADGEKGSGTLRDDAGVIYRSDKLRRIMETVRKISPSKLAVLLTGESGTGKGVIAGAIHSYAFPGNDEKSPFVSINCPALPDTLLESELFGYKKGAFTGAENDYPGKISMADGGTLFLDEIGDLALNVQSKLLKLLEDGVYSSLGSMKEHEAHVRIVSATNQSLQEMIRQKEFRKDLFYRINSIMLEIPPLRDRKEDIKPLAESFLQKFSQENKKAVGRISDAGMTHLQAYSWPGNIRELRNVIHRAVVLSSNSILTAEDFPEFSHITAPVEDAPSERDEVLRILNRNNWNISAAARELNMSRGSLRHRIDKYSL